MNAKRIKNADYSYERAEQKAAHYFQSLYVQVLEKNYIPTLTKDINSWKHNHIRHHSILSLFSRGKGNSGPKRVPQLYPMAELHW